jgi:hypothetical protein
MTLYEVRKRTVIRDGEPQNQAKCPGCGQWADVDAEQWCGDVSLICPECGWHGYVRGERLS